MFFDSHAHLTSDSLYEDVENVLKRAQKASVQQILNICTDLKTLKRGLKLSQKFPWIFNAGSTTPHDVLKEGALFFPYFEKAALEGQLIAIGETGLDYHYEHSPKEVQKDFFKRYLELALKTELPVIIHCRDAFEDFFSIIETHYSKEASGLLHCFTGTSDEAQELVKRKWFLSFSGIITFKKSHLLRDVVEQVPLEQLLIETDAPYLAPQSQRGHTNEPAYVVETAQKIAEIKGLPIRIVAEKTRFNACSLFKIPCG